MQSASIPERVATLEAHDENHARDIDAHRADIDAHSGQLSDLHDTLAQMRGGVKTIVWLTKIATSAIGVAVITYLARVLVAGHP